MAVAGKGVVEESCTATDVGDIVGVDGWMGGVVAHAVRMSMVRATRVSKGARISKCRFMGFSLVERFTLLTSVKGRWFHCDIKTFGWNPMDIPL